MRNQVNRYLVAILLAISAGLLAILIPGGPVETRTFPHINLHILVLFNLFLTLLGMTSAIAIYFVLKDRRWSFWVSALCAIAYFLVYALDLGTVFPVSLDPTPTALLAVEIAGIGLSIPLLILSLRGAISHRQSHRRNRRTRRSPSHRDDFLASWIAYLAIALSCLGTGIVIFATKAAV